MVGASVERAYGFGVMEPGYLPEPEHGSGQGNIGVDHGETLDARLRAEGWGAFGHGRCS